MITIKWCKPDLYTFRLTQCVCIWNRIPRTGKTPYTYVYKQMVCHQCNENYRLLIYGSPRIHQKLLHTFAWELSWASISIHKFHELRFFRWSQFQFEDIQNMKSADKSYLRVHFACFMIVHRNVFAIVSACFLEYVGNTELYKNVYLEQSFTLIDNLYISNCIKARAHAPKPACNNEPPCASHFTLCAVHFKYSNE